MTLFLLYYVKNYTLIEEFLRYYTVLKIGCTRKNGLKVFKS